MSKSKAKGTLFETEVVRYIQETGHSPNARRSAPAGANDVGDVDPDSLAEPTVLECKSEQAMRLAAYIDEAEREAETYWRLHGVRVPGVAVHKRKGKAVSKAYVSMSLETYVEWYL